MRLEGMNVYLSGKVTGEDRLACEEAFLRAWKRCKAAGANFVFNPTVEVREGSSHEKAMRVCLNALTGVAYANRRIISELPRFAVLVSLPGWEGSEGARLEREVAQACGIRCVELGEVG